MLSSFSSVKAQDYGDAPSPYPTAIHQMTSFQWLGPDVSDEGTPRSLDTLDDGITWNPQEVKPGETFDLTFQATSTYQTDVIVRIWIDWNRDGIWDDPVERVVNWEGTVFQEVDGYYRFITQSIDVPSAAVSGTTYIRARLEWAQVSNAPDMSPISDQPFGECEDYAIDVGPTHPEPCTTIVVFSDNFDDGILDSEWAAIDGATVDNMGINEPSPEYSLRLNGHPSGGDKIESEVIDLSSYSSATLIYQYERKGGGESPDTGDDLIIDYWDGLNWIELDRQLGNGPTMSNYEEIRTLLPSDALHMDFRLRIRSIGTSSSSSVYDDWFVDDVKIEACKPVAFEDIFPSMDIDTTKWTVVDNATVDDVGINEPSPENSLRLNGYPSGGDVVESCTMDLSSYSSLILSYHYERTGGGESPDPGDDLIIEYWNGMDWIEIDRQLGSGPDMNIYEEITISLPPDALHPEFRLCIRSIGTSSSSSVYDDWFVDDVKIEVSSVVFEDTFPSMDIDTINWVVVDGVTVDEFGINEPSPDYSLRLNGHPSGGDRIESEVIDLSSCASATLSYHYERTGRGESTDSGDDLIVDYWDGSGWIELDRQLGSDSDMTSYEHIIITLPSDALHADFRLRIRSIGSFSSYYVFDDWFVDDVKIEAGSEPECFPTAYSTYGDWVALGKPDCWCAQPKGSGYQCDGDIDSQTEGNQLYRVGFNDVDLLIENWGKTINDPTLNPCADIDHKPEGSGLRIGLNDLNILIDNWKKTDADLPGDCPRPE
jgi:hypothetical protein